MPRAMIIDPSAEVNGAAAWMDEAETQHQVACDRTPDQGQWPRAQHALLTSPRRRAFAAEKCWSAKIIPLTLPPRSMSKVPTTASKQ